MSVRTKKQKWYKVLCYSTSKWSSINDVTVIGGGGQGFCDNRTKAIVIKRMMMEGVGVKNK